MKKKTKVPQIIRVPITSEQIETLFNKCVNFDDMDGEVDIQTINLVIEGGALTKFERMGETCPEPYYDERDL